MRVSTLFLRRLHKWIGLLLGVQLVIWTASGAAMALIDMEAVAGGPAPAAAPAAAPSASAWPRIREALPSGVTRLEVKPLLGRTVVEASDGRATWLFDAADGRRLAIDAALARRIAEAAYAGTGQVRTVAPLDALSLEVREHALPIWRVDFDDEEGSSFYVSAATGHLLERRNDSWRLWDFFWMLHNMDYANRTSFNHPLIVTVAFGIVWLVATGIFLLFRTAWRPDLNALGRRLGRARRAR